MPHRRQSKTNFQNKGTLLKMHEMKSPNKPSDQTYSTSPAKTENASTELKSKESNQ